MPTTLGQKRERFDRNKIDEQKKNLKRFDRNKT